MSPRTARRVTLLAAAALLAGCGSGGPFEPLSAGTALPVSLTTTVDAAPSTDPLRVRFTAIAGGVKVQWDVASTACLLAEASALRSGPVIEVRIHRSGNPLVGCVASIVEYHYEAIVAVPAPGRYEVRLVDDLLGQPLRPIGRGAVAVY